MLFIYTMMIRQDNGPSMVQRHLVFEAFELESASSFGYVALASVLSDVLLYCWAPPRFLLLNTRLAYYQACFLRSMP